MNLQQLITFSTVISEGSMTAAAEKLFLTQPAVSQQIRNLEEELGVNLLARGTRHAKPTTQGQLLFDYAKRIISLTQQAQVAIQTMGEGMQGNLRVGTLNSLGMYLISPLVGTFLKYNSKLTISLMYEDGEQVYKALQAGQLDCAILPDIAKEYGADVSAFDVRTVMRDEMWLVTSGKDVGVPSSISFKDLNTRPLIRFTERYFGFEKQIGNEAMKGNVKLKPVFESNNVGTVKRVIESGLGWGFLPAHSIRKQVRAGRMTAVDVEDFKFDVPIMFYARKNTESQQIYDMFFNAIKPAVSAT